MSIFFKDRVRQAVSTGGTGSLQLGAASGAQYQALGAADDGKLFPYVIEDGSAWEIGFGTYTHSGTAFARTTRHSSSTGSALTVTTSAILIISITSTSLLEKADVLAAADIAAGAVNITRVAHMNRDLDCPGTTVATFAGTGTSGALKGDLFTCRIGAAGSFTAVGMTAPAGTKLTAGPGEFFTGFYDAAANTHYSTTPVVPVLSVTPGTGMTNSGTATNPILDVTGGGSGFSLDVALSSGFGLMLPNSLGSGTTPQVIGMSVAAIIDSSTFVGSAAATDGVTAYKGLRRVRVQAATTAATRVAGFEGANSIMTGLPTRWPFRIAGAIADASSANGSFVIGMHTYVQSLLSTEPSAQTNCVFVGLDSTDANLQIMHNDASGACTKIDLGGTDFARGQYQPVQVLIDNPNGDGTSLTVQVTNLLTGATSSVHTLSTNLPSTTVQMALVFARSSLATSFQAQVDFIGATTGKTA